MLQVVGANLVPTSVQTQNLITDTLMTMLASDHVFLMRLATIEETSPKNGAGLASMTYVMQKSAATADVSTVLSEICHQSLISYNAAMLCCFHSYQHVHIDVPVSLLSASELYCDSVMCRSLEGGLWCQIAANDPAVI